jgi:hypothetical protein
LVNTTTEITELNRENADIEDFIQKSTKTYTGVEEAPKKEGDAGY